jgi:hypothetical protein
MLASGTAIFAFSTAALSVGVCEWHGRLDVIFKENSWLVA